MPTQGAGSAVGFTSRASGKFVTQLNLAPDFAGQVWAEASYPDGAKKRTETIALTVGTAGAGTSARLDAVGDSVGTDESARSDKLTGGRIRRTKLITQLMGGYERFAASFDPPVLVDVNYDLQVVEGGVLLNFKGSHLPRRTQARQPLSNQKPSIRHSRRQYETG